MKKAVFLDRDGVINRKFPAGQYVTCWQDFAFLPGVADAIKSLNHAEFHVVVVSNQRCVAKGLLTASDLDSIHRRMCRELAANGATIDDVYYCPHSEPPLCGCRKPSPGMLFAAARKHQIDLHASWMIGDSQADVEAGHAAGCKTIRIRENCESAGADGEPVAESLLKAVERILQGAPILYATPLRES
jgi:D-glycero-D-manno-heptose 1,7-bisphosphate phosphatase